MDAYQISKNTFATFWTRTKTKKQDARTKSRAPYLNLKDSSANNMIWRLRNCLVGAGENPSFPKLRRVSVLLPESLLRNPLRLCLVAVSPDAVIRICNFYGVSVSYRGLICQRKRNLWIPFYDFLHPNEQFFILDLARCNAQPNADNVLIARPCAQAVDL